MSFLLLFFLTFDLFSYQIQRRFLMVSIQVASWNGIDDMKVKGRGRYKVLFREPIKKVWIHTKF